VLSEILDSHQLAVLSEILDSHQLTVIGTCDKALVEMAQLLLWALPPLAN
jgi:hypothetical protein